MNCTDYIKLGRLNLSRINLASKGLVLTGNNKEVKNLLADNPKNLWSLSIPDKTKIWALKCKSGI